MDLFLVWNINILMPNSKSSTRASIQYQHDLIKIPCQQLCLVSLECELLKDDFCESLSIPNFQNLVKTFHWMWCFHFVNAMCLWLVFTNEFRASKIGFNSRTLIYISFSSGSHALPVDIIPTMEAPQPSSKAFLETVILLLGYLIRLNTLDILFFHHDISCKFSSILWLHWNYLYYIERLIFLF